MTKNNNLGAVVRFDMRPKTDFATSKFIVVTAPNHIPIFVLSHGKYIPLLRYVAEYFIYGDPEIDYVVRHLFKIDSSVGKAMFQIRILIDSSPMFKDFIDNRWNYGCLPIGKEIEAKANSLFFIGSDGQLHETNY